MRDVRSKAFLDRPSGEGDQQACRGKRSGTRRGPSIILSPGGLRGATTVRTPAGRRDAPTWVGECSEADLWNLAERGSTGWRGSL